MSAVKEPLFHVVKRDNAGFVRGLLVRLAAIVLSLIVCAVIIVLLTGMNPLSVYAALWDGAVGTSRRMWITLRDAAILLCIGFAVMPAFRMRFWNTGAEGQVLVGACATAAVMIYGKTLPSWALYTLCPLAGIAAGLVWGVIPAFFKARWNTNETLFTLMLNYIATQLVAFCIIFWETPKGSNSVGLINAKGKIGWLPNIGKNSYLLPILIVLGLALILFVYMRYTKQGYEISVVGESENTAHYAAINVKRVIIRTMAICGGIAGIAGYLLASGVGHTISTGLAGGRGFTAIIVAWLAQLNPIMILVVSTLFSVLEKGSGVVQSSFGLSVDCADVLQGIILFFILGCEFFVRYAFVFNKKGGDK